MRIAACLALALALGGCALGPAGRDAEGLKWLAGAGPRYPAEAKAEGTEGRVIVEYRVDRRGHVVAPRVVESRPPGVFDEAALAAVRTWRYRPYRPDGEPVAVDGVRSTLRFRLGESPWAVP